MRSTAILAVVLSAFAVGCASSPRPKPVMAQAEADPWADYHDGREPTSKAEAKADPPKAEEPTTEKTAAKLEAQPESDDTAVTKPVRIKKKKGKKSGGALAAKKKRKRPKPAADPPT